MARSTGAFERTNQKHVDVEVMQYQDIFVSVAPQTDAICSKCMGRSGYCSFIATEGKVVGEGIVRGVRLVEWFL